MIGDIFNSVEFMQASIFIDSDLAVFTTDSAIGRNVLFHNLD